MSLPPKDARNRLFVVLCVVCIAASIVTGLWFYRRSIKPVATPGAINVSTLAVDDSRSVVSGDALQPKVANVPQQNAPARKMVYFRATALGANYGKLAVVSLDGAGEIRYSDGLNCDRVYFAAGKGVCLWADRGLFTKYYASSFDEHLKAGWRVELSGIPSRVRVSPNGKFAAITVFVSGHSYTSVDFSTQTLIVNTADGTALGDLEEFSVVKNDAVFKSTDFNFWGVTFAQDNNRFYATLASQGRIYLVEGDRSKKRAKVIYERIECPSLSPDESRIAFKKRTGPISWKLAMLDLKTRSEISLAETRSVDDQVEWLDNDHILYALSENEQGSSASTDIWSLDLRKDGSPQLFLKGAYSPAVDTSNSQR